jgi:hypothetical protein
VEGEKHAAKRRLVGADGAYNDFPTPRDNAHHLTIRNTQGRHVRGRHLQAGFWCNLVERFGTPGHGTGVPVLQQAPGIEHQGVLIVRQFQGMPSCCSRS